MSTTAETAGAASAPGRTGVDSLLARLRGNTLVPLLVAAAAAVALIAALFLWASSPEYRVLFSNLAEADGGRIISELDSRQVPYRLSEGGNAILVPGDRVHVLRLQLAEQGLPQGGNVGLSLLESQAFGISQFAEQVNYQRGLEGELTSSIESLGPVAKARVHLALARDSVFVRDREPAKASVVLTLHPGRALGAGQVNAIMHLVSSSVADLAVSDVTVVDHSGILLSPGGTAPNDLDGAQLSYTREVERNYQQGIENILAPLFGKANIRVQVAAELDFSRREETAERYGPNQNGNPAAVRSTQLNTQYNGSETVARGIPGALSNTPPGWAPSPVDEGETGGGGDAAEAEQDASLSHNNVVNYEVDRNITHIEHQRGQLQRLSVAVVVNHRDGVDEEGNPQRLPLSPEEIDQVNRLVRQAMGFSETRGDRLEVVNSPFTDLPDSDSAEPAWWTTPIAFDIAGTLGRYLLVALLALVFYRLILRPLLRRHLAQQPLATPGEPAITPNAAAAGAAAAQAIADTHDSETEGDPEAPRRRQRKSSSYEQDLKELRDIASEDPRMVAMVVRTWMTDHA